MVSRTNSGLARGLQGPPGAPQSLATTLGIGNNTGPSDIVLDSNHVVISPLGGASLALDDTSGANLSSGSGNLIIRQSDGQVTIISNNGTVIFKANGEVAFNGGSTQITFKANGQADFNGAFLVDTVNTQIGFFNLPPVSQQPTPVTLGDVIAILQAFGLCL